MLRAEARAGATLTRSGVEVGGYVPALGTVRAKALGVAMSLACLRDKKKTIVAQAW